MEHDMEIVLFANIIINYEDFLKKKKLLRINGCRPKFYFIKYYNSDLYRGILSGNDSYIKKHIRVSARSLHQMLLIFENDKQAQGYCLRFRLCVFLYWLACGASYRVTGMSFGISRYTVRTIIHKILNLFVEFSKKIIKLPTFAEYEEIGNHFNLRAKTTIFSKAIGAIDGCHFKIVVPTCLHDQYINRKLDYSLNIMAVCDSYGKFIYVMAGFPGSVHDQRVLRNSDLYKSGNFPPSGYYLLGDSGYKCALTPVPIITPYRHDHRLGAQELQFNLLHSRARSIIENAFGRLKTRWRSIFLKSLELKIENSIKTVVACCIMHNICLNDGVDLDASSTDFLSDNNSPQLTVPVNDEETASAFRNMLAAQI